MEDLNAALSNLKTQKATLAAEKEAVASLDTIATAAETDAAKAEQLAAQVRAKAQAARTEHAQRANALPDRAKKYAADKAEFLKALDGTLTV